MATATAATSDPMGSPALAFARRRLPAPRSLEYRATDVGAPDHRAHDGRAIVHPAIGHQVIHYPVSDHAAIDHPPLASRAFACAEPEGDPYTTRPLPPLPGRPAPDRHPPGAEPAAAPLPGAARPYPVEGSFLQADRIALSLRGALERTTVPLARTATAVVAAKTWCDFGFARLDDYARERLGRSGRWVRDLAALGERLRSLPALAAAITGQDGGRPVGRVAAMLIAKVASPESLDGWIAHARDASIRALRDAVRAARAAGTGAAPVTGDAAAAAVDTRATADADAGPISGATANAGGTHDPGGTPDPGAAPDAGAAPADDDDAANRLLVRMMVPSPVLAAFDEAVDLFRAVEGGEATVAAFVEALVAESAARGVDEAPATGDTDMRVLRAGPAVAAVERALAASTGNWRHLPGHSESSWALSLAGVTLARFRALAAEAGRGGAADLDRQLRALVAIEDEIEARLGGLLADLGDRRAWPRLRFAGVGHYGEERLGLSRTAAEDRARLARDLRRHPRLGEAYAAGLIGRETAALVARLLRDTHSDAASEAAWVARAAGSTVKRMRDEARALGRYRVLGPPAGDRGGDSGGDGGDSSGDGGDGRDRGGHDTTAGAATATGPRSGLTVPAPRRAPAPLDDAAWHASLRREPGLAHRRVRLLGRLAFTSPDVFQALPHEPDVFLRLRLPHDLGGQFLAMVEAERRRLAAAADALPWDAGADQCAGADPSADSDGSEGPGASTEPTTFPDADALADAAPSRLAARMFSIRCRRLPAWVGLLSLLEDFVDTWDAVEAAPRRPGDEVYIRDGWRCTAPGCTSRRNLEDHHLRYRSRGGDDDAANRICLCRFHHQRGEHGGLASCRGTAPIGVVWRLGRRDLQPAWYRNERRLAG